MAEGPLQHAWGYLTQAEVRFLDAAAGRLIPADELGPGAREAGASVYIDRQLCSVWGAHGRNYRNGPWADGTPQQGFQSRLTPREIYRAGIRDTNLHCIAGHGKAFEFLAPDVQDEVLRALESGAAVLESVASALFFELLWRNVEESFFADPLYGGNRDMAGWRLVGFPGVASGEYAGWVDRDAPYRGEPVSILDLARGRGEADGQGYAKHPKPADGGGR